MAISSSAHLLFQMRFFLFSIVNGERALQRGFAGFSWILFVRLSVTLCTPSFIHSSLISAMECLPFKSIGIVEYSLSLLPLVDVMNARKS